MTVFLVFPIYWVLEFSKQQHPVFPKNIGKIMKNKKKTLANWAHFLYNNSARKFSVVF
jgi:hypothetical protein